MKRGFAWTISAGVFATGCDGASHASEPDVPLVATTQEVYTLGGVDAPDWQQFVEVFQVRFDGAGNLVLLDGSQPRIAVVDPAGGLRHFVSRAGDGPGELRSVMDVQVLRDNRVVVSDVGHRALLLFDENGSFVEQFPDMGELSGVPPLLDGSTSPVSVTPIKLPAFRGTLPGARLLALYRDTRTLELRTLGEGSVELHRAYQPPPANASEDGDVAVRMGEIEVPMAGIFPSITMFAPPFDAATLADGRVAIIDSVGYRVKILRDDGTIDAVLERPIDPVPVTPRMREAARHRQESGGGMRAVVRPVPEFGLSSADAEVQSALLTEAIAPRMEYGSEVPVLDDIAVDFDDRIWVTRTGDDGLSEGSTDVFAADGDYVGTLAADGFRVPRVFGPSGLMAYVEVDDLDVAVVRVLRLVSLDLAPASPVAPES